MTQGRYSGLCERFSVNRYLAEANATAPSISSTSATIAMLAVGVTAKAVARFLFHLPNYPFRFATFVILKTLKSLTSGPHIRVKAGQVLSGYLLTLFEERQQVGVNRFGLGRGHTVGKALVGFHGAVPQ